MVRSSLENSVILEAAEGARQDLGGGAGLKGCLEVPSPYLRKFLSSRQRPAQADTLFWTYGIDGLFNVIHREP